MQQYTCKKQEKKFDLNRSDKVIEDVAVSNREKSLGAHSSLCYNGSVSICTQCNLCMGTLLYIACCLKYIHVLPMQSFKHYSAPNEALE